MLMLITRIFRSTLIRGSVTVFIGNIVMNAGNVLYTLLMGRMLGPAGYGDFGALFSLLMLLGTPLAILQLFVVKQTSTYWGQRSYGKITAFWYGILPPLCIASILATVSILLAQRFLGSFLQVQNPLTLGVFAAYFLLSGPAAASRGILHGTLSFTYLAINNGVEVIVKIIVSTVLVFLNFQLVGALLGPLAGGLISFAMSIVELRMILPLSVNHNSDSENIAPKFSRIKKFSPILFASLSLTMFFTADIILVRHFFPAEIAGEYAALSTVGRILFYAMGPVLTVMFPLISSRASSGQSYISSLLATILVTVGLSVGIFTVYWCFPQGIVSILFGERYFGIIPYLGAFTVYMSFYSVNSILTHFLLSISYYRPIGLLFVIALLQIIGIAVFHSGIRDVIWVNSITSALYCLVCVSFVWRREKNGIIDVIRMVIPNRIYSE